MSQVPTILESEPYQEIVIHLENINELFTIPVPDPFSAHVRFVPGIESIQAEIKTGILRHGKRIRTTIFLPKNHMEPNMEIRTQEAIRRYCHFKTIQNHRNIATLRKEAFQALLIGILFLASGLFFPASIERALALPPFFSTLFSDGFTIAFWVILWRPIDFFLFDASAYWKSNFINKRLMEMQIIIKDQ
jgi:hypothetical protein